MPSAYSERYQSRLFNFVHKQSRRWGEGVGRTFRHLQVAASWSIEALMYPIFILVQKATESANKQLHARKQTQNPQLQANYSDFQPKTPPVADIPIQRVLNVVENLPLQPSVDCQESKITPQSHLLQIRAIASQISNRQLVLVTPKNEILDILTPEQQQKLENRILSEIACYWRQWRLSQNQEKRKQSSEINRLLIKLTSGKNKDKIPALPDGNGDKNTDYSYLLNPERSLALLDATVAKLESAALEPISRTSREIIQVLQTQLQIFIYGKEEVKNSRQTLVSVDHPTVKAPNIQNLIEAAINFFFGERQSKKLEPTTINRVSKVSPIVGSKNIFSQYLNPQALPQRVDLNNTNLADTWLSESELFGNSQHINISLNNPIKNQDNHQVLITSSQVSNSPLHAREAANNLLLNLINRFQSFALSLKPKPSVELTQTQKSVTDLTPIQTTSEKIFVVTKTTFVISQPQQHKTTNIKAKPDWIETPAKIIGYEKHPLEKTLGWLDRVMLRLEETIVGIVQFLQWLWRGK